MWPHLFPLLLLLLLLLLLVRMIVWKQDQTVRLVGKVGRFNLYSDCRRKSIRIHCKNCLHDKTLRI